MIEFLVGIAVAVATMRVKRWWEHRPPPRTPLVSDEREAALALGYSERRGTVEIIHSPAKER